METETAPAETYPWDRTEPFIPEVSASLIVVEATPVETFDHPNKTYRVVGLRIGGLTLHTGLSGGDAEVVTVVNRLIESLHELRDAADRRIEIATNGPLPTADDVLGILAEPAAWTEPELREAFGR